WTGTLREYAGGWSDFAAARELARQKQYDEFEHARDRRREIEALLHARRNQARAGGGILAKMTGGSDRRGTKALSGKVRQAARALERVEQVDKPYEPWELHLSLAAAQRPGDRVASLEGAVGERGAFRLAAGTRHVGRSTVIAALDQRRTAYDGAEPLLGTFTARTDLLPGEARTLLAKFNLGAEHVDRPCATLSPGERTRA